MQPDNRFQKLQDDYLALRRQLDSNRITPAQFDAAIKNLMVRDAQGRHWTLGAKDWAPTSRRHPPFERDCRADAAIRTCGGQFCQLRRQAY